MNARDKWPLYAAMTVAGVAAVVASSWTLAALARGAGWVAWSPWLLPAALDVGTAAGVWCWLRPGAPEAARRFAKRLTIVGSFGTLAGNACGHLLITGLIDPGPVLVVVVGAVPAGVLVSLAHLAALLTADRLAAAPSRVSGGGESGGPAVTAATRQAPGPAEPIAGPAGPAASTATTPPRKTATKVATKEVAEREVAELAAELAGPAPRTPKELRLAHGWSDGTTTRRIRAAKTLNAKTATGGPNRAKEYVS